MIRACEKTIRDVVQRLTPVVRLKTALDAGAGAGFFSRTLRECGLSVSGFDGREENVAEARKRNPEIPFAQGDLQDRSILEMGKFDLVLCFGLLYHLENPLLAVRHLRALAEKCLLLESRCVPDDRPSLLHSVDALIGGYRFHADSLSNADLDRYNQRCDKIIESELKSIPRAGAVKIIRRVTSAVRNIPKVRGLWQRIALKSLYKFAGPDLPPIVEDQENKWVIREGTRRIRSVPR